MHCPRHPAQSASDFTAHEQLSSSPCVKRYLFSHCSRTKVKSWLFRLVGVQTKFLRSSRISPLLQEWPAAYIYMYIVQCTVHYSQREMKRSLQDMYYVSHLKGQCHEICCFWFFSLISFSPAPEYSIKTVSNFFENLPRYSQLKVGKNLQSEKF